MSQSTGGPTAAEVEIRSRIADRGRVTFREFMEVALYHPGGSYYTDLDTRGRTGDYYTSPAAHPAFGAAVAVQLRAMWRLLGEPAPFTVVEMGAGGGGLAADVTAYARRLDVAFAGTLAYVPVDLDQAFPSGVTGCVLSNELLDAMPVARFEIVDGEAKEIFVTVDEDGESLTQVLDDPVTGLIESRLASLAKPLPDGSRGEVNPGIGPWMERVSTTLHRGFVMTIDYGDRVEDLYIRRQGTLQTYFRHVDGLSPYQNVGRQDITAHVDFSAVETEGARVGLSSLGLVSQAELLRRNGIDRMAGRLGALDLPSNELSVNRYGLDKLTRPDGLGGFKIFFQEKGTGITALDETWPSAAELGNLPVPTVLGPGHLRQDEGGYPSFSFELDSLWPESPDPDDLGASLPDSNGSEEGSE